MTFAVKIERRPQMCRVPLAERFWDKVMLVLPGQLSLVKL